MIPELTLLRFFILAKLYRDALSGRTIRQHLRAAGREFSGPAFYQLMKHMVKAGLVSGSRETTGLARESSYQITPLGVEATEEFVRFVANLAPCEPPQAKEEQMTLEQIEAWAAKLAGDLSKFND